MMEAARSSETLVNFYQTTWRYNPEDSHLQLHICLTSAADLNMMMMRKISEPAKN
jgi:hypothetical protein